MIFEAIRHQLARSVPFARLLQIRFDAVDGREARTRMAALPQLANHVGSIHAGALFALCESASGAALAGALAELIMRTRFVVRDAHIDYLKPALGEVLARARLAEDGAAVLDALRRDGRAAVAVDVSAIIAADGTETLVAQASFCWQLRLQPA